MCISNIKKHTLDRPLARKVVLEEILALMALEETGIIYSQLSNILPDDDRN